MASNETKLDRLEAAKLRRAKLDESIKRLEAREAAKSRKEDTRLKVLIGAAFLADVEKHFEQAVIIKKTLARAITRRSEREFLALMGWLDLDLPSSSKAASGKRRSDEAAGA